MPIGVKNPLAFFAPIIGHNLSDGVEYALMCLMKLLWR